MDARSSQEAIDCSGGEPKDPVDQDTDSGNNKLKEIDNDRP
jgi:hypothetical protein